MLRPCLVCAVVCLAAGTCAAADRPADFELLVDQLQKVGEPSVGVSTEVAGPLVPSLDGGPGKPGFMVLGSPPPKLASPAAHAPMDALVAAGASSVPVLLKHLDDKRATALPGSQGGQWTDYSTEYDYNHRTLKAVPKGVNVDDENNGNRPHVITVGDLCFVVLGEIVNRNFNAVRLSPGGGIVVNSPTESKTLCDAARAEFGGMNTERLRGGSTDDFLHRILKNGVSGLTVVWLGSFLGTPSTLYLGSLRFRFLTACRISTSSGISSTVRLRWTIEENYWMILSSRTVRPRKMGSCWSFLRIWRGRRMSKRGATSVVCITRWPAWWICMVIRRR